MAKINQIQNRIRELEGGAFQKLADAYIHKKGYNHINSIGSVIGSDKVRKGTPDTLVSLPNGKFVFAEYTTQKDDVYDKLNSDFDKCLSEDKTGVPIERIEEVVFCHTSTLSAKEENALVEKAQKHGIKISTFGIGPISYDLYQKYPGLSRDFLGVEVDTGQIIPPDEFIASWNKSRLATRLDTSFHFRDEEVKIILQGIEGGSLFFVSGRAGVGKSKLVLECCKRFQQSHPKYDVLCIFNRGPDLFEDLRVYFSESGAFLIFVDDANRISRFEYIVQLLQNQREDQTIKVIATVRDYALNKVLEAAQSYEAYAHLELQPFEDKEIKQLIDKEYGIRNQLYLDRIADIAKGNPRLAIMAAEVAKRENTLHSINNVSALYEEYFASIRRDLEDLSQQFLLKVAGIISFLGAVDRFNEDMMRVIKDAFGISVAEFWEATHRLHSLEVVDMYEDEVVRSSDQVLATYLFYLSFFKDRSIDFATLLEHYFPRFWDRLVDSINPVLNAFETDLIIKTMSPSVNEAWEKMVDSGNQIGLLHLMEVFWFVKPTDTLLSIRNKIDVLEKESTDLSRIEFEPKSEIPSPSILSILSLFKYSDEASFSTSLELLFNYLDKRPNELPQILHILIERFGFKHISYIHKYSVQRNVIDMLWERTEDGKRHIFSKGFITVAKKYLRTHFSTSESKSRRTINMIRFDLRSTPDLLLLRQSIWERLFQLYRLEEFKQSVFDALQDYCTSRYEIRDSEIVSADSKMVIPFLEAELDSRNYLHCTLFQSYLDFLEDRNVAFDNSFRDRFVNENFRLSELLTMDWAEKRNLEMDHQSYRNYKKAKIYEYFSGYRFENYVQFFESCVEIQPSLNQKHISFQFRNGILDVLSNLAEQNKDLYSKIIAHYLKIGDPFKLNPILLVEKLVNALGSTRALEIIEQPAYSSKRVWLFSYHQSLSQSDINYDSLIQLINLYRDAEYFELPKDFDFLLKYLQIDNRVIAEITKIIINKAEKNPQYGYALSMLFNPHTEINKRIIDVFSSNLDLLKSAYFAVLKTEQHADYDGNTFNRILSLDSQFIIEYIDHMYETKKWLSRYDDTRDYSFLWKREDYLTVMASASEKVYKREQEKGSFSYTFLEAFFGIESNHQTTPDVEERQNNFFNEMIKLHHKESDYMELIFSVISELEPERRIPFIVIFLNLNQSFEDFQRLPLESSSRGWTGSAVPMHQRRMEFFESLLPLFNKVDFLQHKKSIEKQIEYIQKEIEREKKRDFIKD
jgi:hypothetical protein